MHVFNSKVSFLVLVRFLLFFWCSFSLYSFHHFLITFYRVCRQPVLSIKTQSSAHHTSVVAPHQLSWCTVRPQHRFFLWNTPYSVFSFLVFLSKALNSFCVCPVIPASDPLKDIARELIAVMIFLLFKWDFKIFLIDPMYSVAYVSISVPLVSSASRILGYL